MMCAAAWALRSLGAGLPEMQAAVADPQGLVDREGADALVLVAVPVLAWLGWAWGALGLLLTAASTVPGLPGRAAGWLLAGVLPAGARRAAGLALGLTLSTAAPAVLLPTAPPVPVTLAAAAEDLGGRPEPVPTDWPSAPAGADSPGAPAASEPPNAPADLDWPSAPDDAVRPPPPATPDWPRAGSADHVVLRGDCLWDIAADRLQQQNPGRAIDAAEVQQAVQAWWRANAAVIGPDPDRLLPGQVLHPPH